MALRVAFSIGRDSLSRGCTSERNSASSSQPWAASELRAPLACASSSRPSSRTTGALRGAFPTAILAGTSALTEMPSSEVPSTAVKRANTRHAPRVTTVLMTSGLAPRRRKIGTASWSSHAGRTTSFVSTALPPTQAFTGPGVPTRKAAQRSRSLLMYVSRYATASLSGRSTASTNTIPCAKASEGRRRHATSRSLPGQRISLLGSGTAPVPSSGSTGNLRPRPLRPCASNGPTIQKSPIRPSPRRRSSAAGSSPWRSSSSERRYLACAATSGSAGPPKRPSTSSARICLSRPAGRASSLFTKAASGAMASGRPCLWRSCSRFSSTTPEAIAPVERAAAQTKTSRAKPRRWGRNRLNDMEGV